ncbi:Phosphatidate phosphatase PPAPDC1B [Smittium culicis]|uniref:Phosphatidate phosphatase PPAPDC1B n=1 Tax=Smittium culicis TaxID=133412 RepID=A0A1R1YU86_9FUNG|nr:Phosphatidate phosphatase PPAPDC1B [Smittium culicis]
MPASAPASTSNSNIYFDRSICTQSNPSILSEGFKSFPSGHSSVIFTGGVFTALYLYHKLPSSSPNSILFKYSAMLIPILVSAYVSVSRYVDYWHHWDDITTGILLGSTCSYISFKFLLKDLSSVESDSSSYSPINQNQINELDLSSNC